MGRKPTVNFNMPQGMRRRVRGDNVYYYLETSNNRKEEPLGKDYILALRKYAELNSETVLKCSNFGDAIIRYRLEVLETLKPNTRKIFRSDIKHVESFFSTAPLDQIRPMHIKQFLDKHKSIPTTANRCKRLFSTIFNHARGWGYTDAQNPCEGISGHSLDKRTVYVSDDLFKMVYKCASQPLKDAMDLAYLTGQRPADAIAMTEFDVVNGHLIITQEKTKQPLRIILSGKLGELINRIHARKETHKVVTGSLIVNEHGRKVTQPALRYQFDKARTAAIEANPEAESEIRSFWFYDLRAKAADDTSDDRGDQAASDLLGHDSVKTTQRHYLRRGKIVSPTR